MADYGSLSRLVRRADSVAADAASLVSRALRDVRGEIANLSAELNLAGSADDREKAYAAVRARMAELAARLDRLLSAQNDLAARTAAKSASADAGVEVKYSARRAEAVIETVTPAQGDSLAAVFTDRMTRSLVNSLREATVSVLREQAVSGGSLKSMAEEMRRRWTAAADGKPRFTDAAGREWDTATYFQMNVRTNTMRVYNDCLVDDLARATGSDLVRVSTGGSDPHCACAAWEGAILSVSGKTKGFPTYEQARQGGCFHPNCVHTLEAVDELGDADEIARQKKVPFDADAAGGDLADAQDERKYRLDVAERMERDGLTEGAARLAVDRANLAASIRAGLLREDADALVARLTDAQVAALVKDGDPPQFAPVKRVRGGTRERPKYEAERWRHGSRGGVVHVSRDATAERIAEVCGVTDAKGDAKGKGADGKAEGKARVALASLAAKIEKSGKSDGSRVALPPIDRKTADEIEAVCGVAPKSLTPTVGADEVRHTFKRHGKRFVVNGHAYGEKSEKQTPVTTDDFARIPEIIKGRDKIEKGSFNESGHVPSVKFVKKLGDGTTYSVFAVADSLEYKTMWKRK